MYDDKQYIHIVSKYVPTKYLLLSKGKVEILQWQKSILNLIRSKRDHQLLNVFLNSVAILSKNFNIEIPLSIGVILLPPDFSGTLFHRMYPVELNNVVDLLGVSV